MIIRTTTPADVPVLHDFIVQLATFEREPQMVKMTPEELHSALFGTVPRLQAVIVEAQQGPLGFAVFSESFSTWTGKPSLYVEDVFITEPARGQGAGRLIFQHLAALSVARGYHRVEWSVLDWNHAAIGFYLSIGAAPMAEWTKYRLSGDALHALAQQGT